jgi:hypothetical protein
MCLSLRWVPMKEARFLPGGDWCVESDTRELCNTLFIYYRYHDHYDHFSCIVLYMLWKASRRLGSQSVSQPWSPSQDRLMITLIPSLHPIHSIHLNRWPEVEEEGTSMQVRRTVHLPSPISLTQTHN